jgi:hypothetical protein
MTESATESPTVVFKNVEPETRTEQRHNRNWIPLVALLVLAVAGLAAPASATPAPLPDPAASYGVNVGDTVDISALRPAVAATHAVVTGTSARLISIKVGSDSFDIRWENLTHLKPVRKK